MCVILTNFKFGDFNYNCWIYGIANKKRWDKNLRLDILSDICFQVHVVMDFMKDIGMSTPILKFFSCLHTFWHFYSFINFCTCLHYFTNLHKSKLCCIESTNIYAIGNHYMSSILLASGSQLFWH